MVTAILVPASLLILYLMTKTYIVTRGLRLPRLPIAVSPETTDEDVSFAVGAGADGTTPDAVPAWNPRRQADTDCGIEEGAHVSHRTL